MTMDQLAVAGAGGAQVTAITPDDDVFDDDASG